jgi:hypothetical protein
VLQQLSFKQHPLLAILQQGEHLLPGAIRIVAIYFDDKVNHTTSIENTPSTGAVNEISIHKKIIENFRNEGNNKTWISATELGFINTSGKVKQLSLEDELDNNSLVLKFKNDYDNNFDVVVIQFNKDKNNFELEANPQPLNTTNKSIIGHLLFNSLQSFISVHKNNMQVFEQIAKSNNSLQGNLSNIKSELNTTQQQLKESLNSVLQQHLSPFEKSTGKKFTLSESAFEKLKQFKGNTKELKNIIEQAANIALNLSFSDQVKIESEHILLEQYQVVAKEEKVINSNQEISFNRYGKTNQLLDRYEKAARILLEKELSLTSKNLGLYCMPAISAPAISDAIKKHRNKILSLLELHPEKWSIIRSEFKPILNIHPKGPELGKMLLGA